MSRRAATLRERAPAKLNLSLRVVGRRPDGYHLIDSVVAFADLVDTVELRPGHGPGFTVDGPFASVTPTGDDNLVLRAAKSLGLALGRPPPGSFHLIKRLPVAAGIGGGSADAAAALRLLARHWSVGYDDPRLARVALDLGADVPVCLRGRRSHMSGVGEIVRPLPAQPSRPVVLVNPRVALPTARVFGQLSARSQGGDPSPSRSSVNDLTAPAIELAPQIADVLATLSATRGCRTAAMSGSGPTCFGLYDNAAEAGAAAASIGREHPSWWAAATRLLD